MVWREIAQRPLTPADADRIQGPREPVLDSRAFPVGATRGYTIGGERRLTRKQFLAFPTDPLTAYDRILAHVGDGGHSVEGQVFDAIGTALRESPAPSDLRAALYRALALVPGVTLVGTLTDRAGRSGTAVAFTEAGTRRELIFDPETSELLAEREVLVDPTSAEIDATPGTVLGDVAYLERAVVNTLD